MTTFGKYLVEFHSSSGFDHPEIAKARKFAASAAEKTESSRTPRGVFNLLSALAVSKLEALATFQRGKYADEPVFDFVLLGDFPCLLLFLS